MFPPLFHSPLLLPLQNTVEPPVSITLTLAQLHTLASSSVLSHLSSLLPWHLHVFLFN